MSYVYEGEEPVRVNNVRYAPGAITDNEDVKGKPGFRSVKDDEAAQLASQRPGTFADAKPDAVEQAVADKMRWVGLATTAVPLNTVVGDNEAPHGPPTGTITTKQAVMREAGSSVERKAFGDGEWLPEDAKERNLADSTSGKVQAAQASASGALEEVTQELQDAAAA
ncbi:MAG TPA: hypothetical protein VKD72_27500, partial [Gemmataceae bacterium]|nr:hypothetical protein [Gemmataceae bacterium]